MNIYTDDKNLVRFKFMHQVFIGILVFALVSVGVAWAESTATSSPEPTKSAETTDPSDIKGDTTDSDAETIDEGTSEPSLITDPMQMRFRISKLDRGISSESRLFVAPRVITLTAIGPIAQLNESTWRGKRLAVFHKSPIFSSAGNLLGASEEKVGEIKIQSVYQSTLQAIVILDDVTRGLKARKGAARVVMLGDIARLEKPIKAAPKPKVKRYVRPKKRSPYEREDMRWRL